MITSEQMYIVHERLKERIGQSIIDRQERIKKEIDSNDIKIKEMFKYIDFDNQKELANLCALIGYTIELEKEYKQPYRNLFNS